jgi:hypothetical protein
LNALLPISSPYAGQVGEEGKNMKRQVKNHTNDDLDSIPMSYLLYIVLGLVVVIAGAAIVIVRMFQNP